MISPRIVPRVYVVKDVVGFVKLLLDSQLDSTKSFDCASLVIKRASDLDVQAIGSYLEEPTCQMRGLRNLAHICLGKVCQVLALGNEHHQCIDQLNIQ